MLITKLLYVFFVDAEVMSDLVKHGESNLLAQLGGIGKVAQQRLGKNSDLVGKQGRIEVGAFGKRDAFVEAIKGVRMRIEAHRFEVALFWSFFHHDDDVVEVAAEFGGEAIEHLGGRCFQFRWGHS